MVRFTSLVVVTLALAQWSGPSAAQSGVSNITGDSISSTAAATSTAITTVASRPTTAALSTASGNGTTTPSQDCAAQRSCDNCVSIKSAKCVWCEKESRCKEVLSLGLTDIGQVCDGGLWSANWGLCAVNMMALIIGTSVAGGVVLIALTVCCCCCCCRSNGGIQRLRKEDARLDQEQEARRQKYAEKKAERQAKQEEIRRKYGLMKDETPYQRFDA